jgi:predicted nucleotidyltransferase
MTTAGPVLQKFRAALTELYGERIERVVLYGSRARRDAQPDSNYDIALFLKGLTDTWSEVRSSQTSAPLCSLFPLPYGLSPERRGSAAAPNSIHLFCGAL